MQSGLRAFLLFCSIATGAAFGASTMPGHSREPVKAGETPDNGAALLDPATFRTDHHAFVAYAVASKIEETLREVPCYCPCRQIGHRSLHDCFSSRHGALCPLCQKEAVYCYLERRKGKSAAQICQGLAKGKVLTLGLTKEMDRLYKQIQKSGR